MNKEDKKAHLEMIRDAVTPNLIPRTPQSDQPKILRSPCECISSEEEYQESEDTELIFFVDHEKKIKDAQLQLDALEAKLWPQCNSRHNRVNRSALNWVTGLLEVVRQLKVACEGIDSSTKNCRQVEIACMAFENFQPSSHRWHLCSTSGNRVSDFWNFRYLPVQHAMVDAYKLAFRTIMANANRDYRIMRDAYNVVKRARQKFESSDPGREGISTIRNAHNAFVVAEQSVNEYYFGRWYDSTYDPKFRQFLNKVRNLHNSEARLSSITELDRLRDEYATRGRPTPLPEQFTQSASSANFSFSELNSGSYSWAMITQELLDGLEAVRAAVGNKRIRVLSGYRNPAHNDSLPGHSVTSRHQYGAAADVCPGENLTGRRRINWRDRDKLAAAAEDAGFNEIIKKRICVHIAIE